ncbi:RECQL2 [Symbiodinium pilosum]|uniref:DNA 3'-5' helicase n=1 Tax=Symbiodinium pilosum TaxID=2952 RepID=A0A812Y7R4_SYMPI|nr:RECQL2 [Symbiodinium pilosum]
MSGAVELRAPTDRPNLFYAVRHRPKAAADVLAAVLSTILLFPRGTPGLVYCITRKEAEVLRQGLAAGGVPCEFYHGDLDAAARQKVHSSWVEGRIDVVVATVAFGMGINKSDVRFVVHAGLPASLHHYYQEAGRAGRDGKPALCLLLYRPSDVPRHSVMNYYKPASLRELYGAAMYCQGRECRRARISRHFGEDGHSIQDTVEALKSLG